MQLCPIVGSNLRYAISPVYVNISGITLVLFLIFPKRLKCFVCIIPSLVIGLFVFYITGAVISDKAPTFSVLIKVIIQAVAAIVVFILLMILALKIFPYSPRPKDEDLKVQRDPTLLKYEDDD